MDIIGFALAVLLIELTPGPNMAWLAGLSATEGRRAGLAAVLGIAIGLLANGVLAALGLAVVLQAEPRLLTGLRLAGAAMMLWLAIGAWRGPGKTSALPSSDHTARRAMITGGLINLLNPKAYIFFVVVAPQFLNGGSLQLGNALLLAAISAAIASLIHIGIVAAGSQAQVWLSNPVRTRIVRRVFAVVMVIIAASFLLPQLR